MSRSFNPLRKFIRSEDGPTAVEYAVMLAMIVLVCLTAVKSVGTQSNKTFKSLGNSLKKANK